MTSLTSVRVALVWTLDLGDDPGATAFTHRSPYVRQYELEMLAMNRTLKRCATVSLMVVLARQLRRGVCVHTNWPCSDWPRLQVPGVV